MKPRSVDRDAGLVGGDLPAVGRAAHAHQHGVVGLRLLRRVGALEGHPQRVGPRLDRGRPRRHHDAVEAVLVHLLPDAHEVAIGARHQAVEHLDHVEARAERRVDRAHLEADDAAADHQHPLGHFLELQRAGRVEDARIVGDEGQAHDLRARRDDGLREFHDLLRARLGLARALGQLDLDVVRVEELAHAADDLDLARLGHAGEAAGQLADHLVLPAAQRREVDLRRAERDAVIGQVLRLVDRPRRRAAAPCSGCTRR